MNTASLSTIPILGSSIFLSEDGFQVCSLSRRQMQSFHVLLPLQSSRFRFIPVKGVLPFCGGDFERDVCVHQHWHSVSANGRSHWVPVRRSAKELWGTTTFLHRSVRELRGATCVDLRGELQGATWSSLWMRAIRILWSCSLCSLLHRVTDQPQWVTDGPQRVTNRPHAVTDQPHILTDWPHRVADRPQSNWLTSKSKGASPNYFWCKWHHCDIKYCTPPSPYIMSHNKICSKPTWKRIPNYSTWSCGLFKHHGQIKSESAEE